ncbi:MAG: ABC transporter substrate-binding protein [Candidatus Bathyarchaeota archaeon]
MQNSKAVSKIQAVLLVLMVIVSALIGAYLISRGNIKANIIRVGVAADLGTANGDSVMHGAILAAEEINAEGGILGRSIEIVEEDTDEADGDMLKVRVALTKLVTSEKVDYLTGNLGPVGTSIMQDISAEHKKIFLSTGSFDNTYTLLVQDNYDKYKYFFRIGANETSAFLSLFDSVLTLREITGFNKLGYLISATLVEQMRPSFNRLVEVDGFELVYEGAWMGDEVDFSSFFAAAEESGTEMMISFFGPNDVAIIKEWYDRKSPMVIWGISLLSQSNEFWAITEGKCEHQSVFVTPSIVGYPITNKTVPFRDAFINRWNENPTFGSSATYEAIRYLLPDAINRAGTFEPEEVIKALEEIDVETPGRQNFRFTSNHDLLLKDDDITGMVFQWQANGTRVPVYPKEIMDEAGVTYTYPDWPGPWDEIR